MLARIGRRASAPPSGLAGSLCSPSPPVPAEAETVTRVPGSRHAHTQHPASPQEPANEGRGVVRATPAVPLGSGNLCGRRAGDRRRPGAERIVRMHHGAQASGLVAAGSKQRSMTSHSHPHRTETVKAEPSAHTTQFHAATQAKREGNKPV